MKAAVIIVFILSTCFGFLLKYLNYRNRNSPIPKNVQDVYDAETYKKRYAYEMENLKLGIVWGVCSLALMTVFLAANVFSGLNNFMMYHTENVYIQTFYMFGAVLLVKLAVDTAFEAYDTFKIEAKYGFNKTTVKTFVIDVIKNTIIGVILMGGLLALFMAIYNALGNWAFLIFAFVITALAIALLFFNIQFQKIFHKFTPLEDGTLKVKIETLARNAGYPIKRIYTLNASKRTTKLNAFFTGIGKNKTIALYDNLIEKMSEDEVVAVLGHEVGHERMRHLPRRAPYYLLRLGVLLIFAFFIVGQEAVSLAFGFNALNVGFGVFICMILYKPLSILLRIPTSMNSRKHEYEADAFGAKHTSKAHMISSLKKLAHENYTNLTPHPFVVLTTFSHPPITQRVEAIAKLKTK
jgi:STE24 endopeptidase